MNKLSFERRIIFFVALSHSPTAMEGERELTRQLQNHCKDDDGDAGAPPSVTEPNTSALHFSLEVSAMEKEGREGGKDKERKKKRKDRRKTKH